LKQQLDFISLQLEWPQLREITATNAGENATKQELLYIAGGNANEYKHYGKQNRDSSKI
jgi:hypothetical protein